MSRPLRLELAGGVYHVTSRGDGRDDIYLSDTDRQAWLEVFGQVCKRFNWVCHAWCQMTNHYHVLIETPEANLAHGMRQLNGVYTQRFNRAHGRVGHVFQGRYKAILVERDSYLLELARYVVLNPLRAGMVKRLETWPWSSYRASTGLEPAAPWLAVDGLLAQFSGQRSRAQTRYAQFVAEGIKAASPWLGLKGQVFLGDEQFVERMQARMRAEVRDDVQVPVVQRRPPPPSLQEIERGAENRNVAIKAAYATGAYSYQEIADYFGIHFTTVGNVVRRGR